MTRKEFSNAVRELNKLEDELKFVRHVYDILTNDEHPTVGVSLAGVALSLYSDDIVSALITKRNALVERINNLYNMFGISSKEETKDADEE